MKKSTPLSVSQSLSTTKQPTTNRRKWLRLSIMSSSMALLFSTPAMAANFSQTVFFGDSLTDSGYFKNSSLVQFLNPNTDAKFTTNPDLVWAEHLANAYGSNATSIALDENGNNYAGGGAKVSTAVNNAGLIPLSLEEQVDKHLNERSVDPNALYNVWIGANDIFAANDLAATDADAANTAIFEAATNAGTNIKKLHDNGAKYIAVFNLPDIGLTPLALDGGADSQKLYTEQSTYYNDTLTSSLNKTGANIIALDAFSLLQEVVANPSAYGYTNATGRACNPVTTPVGQSIFCTPNHYIEENANNTYVFADSVHPTGITHASLATYAQSVIEAPLQIGQASLGVHEAGFTNSEIIQNHLNLINNKPGPVVSSTNIWGNISLNNADNKNAQDSDNTKITVGVESNGLITNQSTSGVYLQHNKYSTDLTNNSGSLASTNKFDTNSLGAGIYHKQYFDNGIDLSLNLSANKLDTSSNRQIELSNSVRKHEAEGDGSQYIASARLGKTFNYSHASIAPYAQLDATKTNLSSLIEDGAKSSAMNYAEQNYTDTNAQIGINAKMDITQNLSVFGQTAYSTRLSDADDQTIQARVNNLNVNYFSLPLAQDADNDGINSVVGLQGDFLGLTASVGVTHSSIDNVGTGAFLEVNKNF